MLDLGCGDSHFLAHVLSTAGAWPLVSSYTGVDMSAAAMRVGKTNLAAALPTGAVRHVQTDMLSYARGAATASVDCVFASFAVHHLCAADKAALVKEVRRVLKPGGAFLLIDIFLSAEQDRDAYMKAYLPQIASWSELSETEVATVSHHVATFDQPAELNSYRSWAGGMFASVGPLQECEFYKLVAFEA